LELGKEGLGLYWTKIETAKSMPHKQ